MTYDDWKCTPPWDLYPPDECDECGAEVRHCEDTCPRVVSMREHERKRLERIAAAAALDPDDDICF